MRVAPWTRQAFKIPNGGGCMISSREREISQPTLIEWLEALNHNQRHCLLSLAEPEMNV